MISLFLVMIGGALGAGARYLTGAAMLRAAGPGWPWGTLTVNLAGGFLMGVLAGWLARHGDAGSIARLLLGVGVLGGFTTFSAFSLDVVLMLERGEFWPASGYALASVIGSVVALMAGLSMMRAAA